MQVQLQVGEICTSANSPVKPIPLFVLGLRLCYVYNWSLRIDQVTRVGI